MRFIIPFCHKDARLAANLCLWIGELGGVGPSHKCLMLAAKATPVELRQEVLKQAKASLGCPVEIMETVASNERGWPESCNYLFYCAAAKMRKLRENFLWLEPDCVPLRKSWLDEIATEYTTCGKPYMGFVYDKPWPHLTGCAVYPWNIAQYNSLSLLQQRNPKGPLPWDVVNAAATLKHCHTTKLIHHEWGENNVAPTFPTASSLSRIPVEAVLYHRCKDGSAIERFREANRKDAAKPSLISKVVAAASSAIRKITPHPKIDLLYICVRSPSEPNVPRNFNESHERFVRTYKQFKPIIPHRLLVVCYNGERDAETDKLFAGLNPDYTYYNGNGRDIGAYLNIGRTLDSDFVVCCNSNVHFHRPNWLERMVEAFQLHGPGVYGPVGSYETAPHLRTFCIATTPSLLRKYPFNVTNLEEAYRFESGIWNFTSWVSQQGLPALMVMPDGELKQSDWRKPQNIFRRGDQTNCLIWDRYTHLYFHASVADQIRQSALADGKKHIPSITVVAATSLSPKSHAEAINRTAAAIPHFCRKLLFAPSKPDNFSGDWSPLPEPWAKNGTWTLDDLSDFMLRGLCKFIDTDVAIVVHWDGFATNPSKWTDEFLKYDYIGAPWPKRMKWLRNGCRVGNGGFSLRSRKWLDAASKLPAIPPATAEDVYSNVFNIKHFTYFGCKIAPLNVAMNWSLEHRIEEYPNWKIGDSFGFHGLIDKDPTRKHLRLASQE